MITFSGVFLLAAILGCAAIVLILGAVAGAYLVLRPDRRRGDELQQRD